MSDVLSWIRQTTPLLIGHRGFPEAAQENTSPSFEAALEAGCDGVELDVRLTRDGVPVIHHDGAVPTGEGSLVLGEVTWAELRSTPFQGKLGPYSIPSLEEVILTLSGRGLINVEIKPPGPGRRDEVAAAVIRAIDRVRPRESTLVSSFDPDTLSAVHQLDRGCFLGFLFSSMRDLNHLEESEVADRLTALHPRHDLVDARLMKRAKERSLGVHAWTVDDPAEASRLVELGVNSVITNHPDRIEEALFS
jgi:glycerophosphoryl diester phosphodiesterase